MRKTLHILRYAVPALLVAAILLPAPVAADDSTMAGTDKMRAVEAKLLKDINRIRVQNGRKPLRLDKRVGHVARARSSDMAAKRYFAHVEPDGDDAERILDRRDIQAATVLENIGHTVGLTLKQGSKRMATWWYHSPPHREQMLTRHINYVGIGVARRGTRFTYTAVFTRSPDQTSPRVVIDETEWQPSADGPELSIDWHGVDPKLAAGTAGIKRFEIEHFAVPGGWTSVDGDPQRSKRSFRAFGADDPHIRIRAVDKAGNVGPWNYAHIDIPQIRPGLI